jgi:2-dehydro-3-deoxyphosphogluconate aldolase/(4S)-4-hydroxy-2-oxoglutarate aldolase
MSGAFNQELFGKLPVVGILRFFGRAEVENLVRASMEGGLCNIEVTMNSAGAADLICLAREIMGDRGNVGAGTVVSMEGLEAALAAGATFIVMPAIVADVIRACVERKVPVMPGAMTPTEILTAWRMGATQVKVFPADQLGPGHIRAVKAPFPDIPLMATGGVTVETLPEFKRAGADGFGVGSPLFDRKQAAAGNWGWFREQAGRFVKAFQES